MMRFLIALAGALVFFTGPPVRADAFPGFPGQNYPSVGADRHPRVLIDFGPGNSVNFFQDSSQGPYDGVEDTYIGIRNHSGAPVLNFVLVGTQAIFSFDGDGIDTYGQPGNSFDRTGYGGPRVFFTNINGAQNTGTVNIVNGLNDGDFTFFSLELQPSSADLGIVPEPGSLTIAGVTALGLLGFGWRRKQAA
jgi:hypothetical protein